MYEGMYVCVCVSVCMYVCVCVCKYVRTHESTCVREGKVSGMPIQAWAPGSRGSQNF